MRTLVLDVEPAEIEMPGGLDALLEARLLYALFERVRTSRPELAAHQHVDQRRRHALDRVWAVWPLAVEARDRDEQAPRVRHLRVVEEIARARALGDATRVHDENLVRDVGDD